METIYESIKEMYLNSSGHVLVCIYNDLLCSVEIIHISRIEQEENELVSLYGENELRIQLSPDLRIERGNDFVIFNKPNDTVVTLNFL